MNDVQVSHARGGTRLKGRRQVIVRQASLVVKNNSSGSGYGGKIVMSTTAGSLVRPQYALVTWACLKV
jgi:hypothetical protein